MEEQTLIMRDITPEFVDRVISFQSEVLVGKNRYNDFADFKYRSLDDILDATKPAAQKNGLLLVLSDDVVLRDNRFYVRATAVLTDGVSRITTHAYAREVEQRKQSDPAQITGMASTYARKYCLAGLLQLGGVEEDADSRDNSDMGASVVPVQEKNNILRAVIRDAKDRGYTSDDVKVLLSIHFNKVSSKDITLDEVKMLQADYVKWLQEDIPAKQKSA